MVKWVLGGLGAVLFGLFMVYVTYPRAYADLGVHFDGELRRMIPVGEQQLLVVEHVEAGGGEDGPTSVGDRWRIVDVTTGTPVVGPHLVDQTWWLEVDHGLVLVGTMYKGFEVRGLDNAVRARLASFATPTRLRDEVTVGTDGQLSAMSDDGRYFRLDPVTLKAEPLAAAPQPRSALDPKPRAYLDGFPFVGSPRASVNGKGPDYLEPEWLGDPQTHAPIRAAGGHVALHYQRVMNAPGGRGPMLSAIAPDGTETWKYPLPFDHFFGVAVFGDRLIVGVNEHAEGGPAWLRAISLSDGKELWRAPL